MEVMDEILSDRIDYLHALRHAEPLPNDIFVIESKAINISSKLKHLSIYIFIAIGASLLTYLIVMANNNEKKKKDEN